MYSAPAGNFSDLIVTTDAVTRGESNQDLRTLFLAARRYTNVDVDIASDLNIIESDANHVNIDFPLCKVPLKYVDIPEIKAAHDLFASCWASRHRASSFILLHGLSGCGKTACIKHFLNHRMIQHEFFDCSALYSNYGSLFTAAVHSVARQTMHKSSTLSSRNIGAVLVLDRLECMFPSLSPHAQVISFCHKMSLILFCFNGIFQLCERRQFCFCLESIDKLMNGGNAVIVGITSTLTSVDPHIMHVSRLFQFELQ